MVRTRFAPSPTGYLHVGGLRTALYSYLFAKKNGGQFLLRIEDTDQKRYVEGALENLLRTLEWAGLKNDEGPVLKDGKVEQKGDVGPYIQSERTELYREHAQLLIEKGAAYPCFCTSERLEEMRKKQESMKMAPMYDRLCLKLTPEEIQAKKDAGTPFVIRQKIPHGEKVRFTDLIRGVVVFETSNVDDQVLMKSDNFPTYHLANVVDDHLMQITHAIRGEEWLPSTPKHLLLYKSFGWLPPEYAHIPLLLNKDKSKLSKRQGDVSVEDYIQKGYTKEALINFIVLLGWHPGKGVEEEIFSMQDLIQNFSLEKVHKAGAIFDVEKLNWFNFQWQKKGYHEKLEVLAKNIDSSVQIQTSPKGEKQYIFADQKNANDFAKVRGDELIKICGTHLYREWLSDPRIGQKLITIEEKILRNPNEVEQHIKFYFNVTECPKDLFMNAKMGVDNAMCAKALSESAKTLESMENFDSMQTLQENLLKLVTDLGIKNGQLLWPMRVALTGEQFSPGVFELLWALGKEESLKRLNDAKVKFFS